MNSILIARVILRFGIGLVILWFGVNQLLNPQNYLGYLPEFTYNLPVGTETIIFLNGLFEIVFGLGILIGLLTRLSALLIFLHLVGITLSLGVNDVAVRDFGLALATLAIVFNGSDSISVDAKLAKISGRMKNILKWLI